jgi:hypothetical protein
MLESRSYCVSYYNFRGLGLQPYSFASNLDKYSTDFSRYATPCIYESLILFVHITYSITEPDTSPNPTKRLGGTNSCYASSISSLLNKEPMYIVLASNLEDVSVSFLYVRALCLVPLQFPQRCVAS